jgi:hypothetical protein
MTAQQFRPVLKAFYLVGILALYGALSDPFIQVWPFRPGDVNWRFGAVGLFSGAMTGVVFALAWLLVVALLLSNRVVARGLAVLSLVLSPVLVLVAVAFVLDYLQVRAGVQPQLRGGLDATVARALLFIVLSTPATLMLGLAGWRMTRVSSRARAEAQGALVYRTE